MGWTTPAQAKLCNDVVVEPRHTRMARALTPRIEFTPLGSGIAREHCCLPEGGGLPERG